MRTLLATLVIILSGLVLSPTVGAVSVINCDKAGVSASDCAIVKSNDLNYESGASRIWKVVAVALGILGGIAVIMIIIGGIKYTTSQGDSSQMQSAKNTILYSVIGLVVALLASTIVLLVQNYFIK